MDAARVPIILTRPEGSNDAVMAAIPSAARARLHRIDSPLMAIVRKSNTVDLSGIDGVIFTSSNGVRHAPHGAGRHAFCVGARTVELAGRHGWRAEMSGRSAEELIAALSRIGPMCLVHLAGAHRRGDVARRLARAGHDASVVEVYDQPLLTLSLQATEALTTEPMPIVPLFSPRSAAQFVSCVPSPARFSAIAMSAAVADPLRDVAGCALHVVAAPDLGEMARMIEKIINGLAWVEGFHRGE